MRNNGTRYAALLFASFLTVGCHKKLPLLATDTTGSPTNPGSANIPLFVLDGQSNMTGDGDPTVIPADPSVIWRGTAPQKGVGYSFAKDYLRKTQRSEVIMIQCAKGGTYIAEHQPGTPIFDACVAEVQKALVDYPTAKISGILFYQGESDAIIDTPNWSSQFVQAMRGYRNSFGDNKIPVVFCQIATTAWPASFPYWAHIQAQQAATSLDNAVMVKTSDITNMADQVHLSATGLMMVGERMSQAYFGLLDN